MPIAFTCIPYAQLTKDQLYGLLALRAEVFIVEQQCKYQDLDGYDDRAQHILATDGQTLAGCARILPPGLKREQPSIGRYAMRPIYRGEGNGRALFQYSIDRCQQLHPGHDIYIQAQHYLQTLYESFGFFVTSDVYDEAGLPHVDMLLAAK